MRSLKLERWELDYDRYVKRGFIRMRWRRARDASALHRCNHPRSCPPNLVGISLAKYFIPETHSHACFQLYPLRALYLFNVVLLRATVWPTLIIAA